LTARGAIADDRAACAAAQTTITIGGTAMKRWAMLFVATAGFALWAQAGSAQAPAATTLSFYESGTGSTFNIVDQAPRSPSKNPQSKKYRFSVGDELFFSERVFDHKGGTRLGTLYGQGNVIKGTTFANVLVIAEVVYAFNNGDQLVAHGVFSFAKDVRVAITGGTGAYQGARGSVASVNSTTDDSSQDTVTLLP
jgi:hypothetical protein